MKKIQHLIFIVLLTGFYNGNAQSKYSKEPNIIYGTQDGLALLMDLYKPAKSNGIGIVLIPGSAFGYHNGPQYDNALLKEDFDIDSNYMGKWAKALIEKGYTLFVIGHRTAPAYKYKDIIGDCRRAVRFIKANAKKYAIDPNHIGAMGHSSGANLCAMLGTLDDSYENAYSKTDSLSSRVQAVVTLAAPFDLSDYNKSQDTAIANNFALKVMLAYIGDLPEERYPEGFVLTGKFAEASPITHVSPGDAPILIYYSDNDPVIPARQALNMQAALQKNNVACKTVARKGQYHGPQPDINEIDKWFLTYLK